MSARCDMIYQVQYQANRFAGAGSSSTAQVLRSEDLALAAHAIPDKADHPDGPGARAFYALRTSEKTGRAFRAWMGKELQVTFPRNVTIGGRPVPGFSLGENPERTSRIEPNGNKIERSGSIIQSLHVRDGEGAATGSSRDAAQGPSKVLSRD